MKYTKATRAKVASLKRGDKLTFDGIPKHFVYGSTLTLHHYVTELKAWLPATVISGLRRRGVKVGF